MLLFCPVRGASPSAELCAVDDGLLHIRAQIGEYYLIDVESGRTTDTVWLNEAGEPVYSRDARRDLALIAKEDYWAGRPDYRIFKEEGGQMK